MGFKDYFANFFDNDDDFEDDYYEQETVDTSDSKSFEEPVAESAESPAPLDDPDLPPGFEMPDLSDLDAMMKEAGL